jgi:transcriptional regulator with XRE-family HTH domain
MVLFVVGSALTLAVFFLALLLLPFETFTPFPFPRSPGFFWFRPRCRAARDLKKLSGRQTSSKNWDMTIGYNQRYSQSSRRFFHSFGKRSAMALPYTIAARKAPNAIDRHVGSRMRMRRKMLAMSQTQLGAALGLTFQQVQKYEKGTNRIGASRLQQISHVLQVPVEFFFEGAPNESAPHGSIGNALSVTQIDDFISDSDGLRLIRAFMRVDNAAVRRRIVKLVEEIAGDDDN